MKTNYLYMILLSLPLFAGCDRSEDTTPSFAEQNVFVPADDDMSETAQIRRDFYNATGSYLLFNDTLRAVSTTSLNGSTILKNELLDVMGYAMIGNGSSTLYKYDYITDAEAQRDAVNLIRTHLLNRMGRALPYAFFIVNSISYYDSSKKTDVQTDKLLGLRAYAISMSDGKAYDDPETYFKGMITDMIRTKLLTMSDEELSPFYDYSREYYYEYKTDFGLPATKSPDADMWEFGFFTDIDTRLVPNNTSDLQSWIAAVTSYSREQFDAKYGSVPIMMNKYDALVSIIEDLGYVLE